ncbi:MAG: hypothetical protein PHV74_10355 [Dehalococcoidia bacterium]|nr:hypothetical protein [Dehalococcoidia bacterium]
MVNNRIKTIAVAVATVVIAGIGLVAYGCGSDSDTEEASTLVEPTQSAPQNTQTTDSGNSISNAEATSVPAEGTPSTPGSRQPPSFGSISDMMDSQLEALVTEGILTAGQAETIQEMVAESEGTEMDTMRVWDSAVTAGILTEDEVQQIQEYLMASRTMPPEGVPAEPPANGTPEAVPLAGTLTRVP